MIDTTAINYPAVATLKQIEKVQELIARIEDLDFHNNTDYEFKTLEVTDNTSEYRKEPTLCLYTVTGRKNDEGTMAACFCRTYRQIFIGPDGGISVVARRKDGKGHRIIKGRKALYRSAR